VRNLLERAEGDPALQYKIHKVMSRVWLIAMVVTVPVVIWAPVFWAKIGILLVAEISYYANWATDNGAMSAASASTPDNVSQFAIDEAADAAAEAVEETLEDSSAAWIAGAARQGTNAGRSADDQSRIMLPGKS